MGTERPLLADVRDVRTGLRPWPAGYQDAHQQRRAAAQNTTSEDAALELPPELTKHLPHGSLALFFGRVAEEFLRVQFSRGYTGTKLGSIRFRADGPVIRHFLASPVPVDVSSLTRLPWLPWAPRDDRDGLGQFQDSRVVPICDHRGLVGLLMMARTKAHFHQNARDPSARDLARLAAFVRRIQTEEHTGLLDTGRGDPKARAPATLSPEVQEVAHDLNNNFATILAHAYTLRGGEDAVSRGIGEAILETTLDASESLKAMVRPAGQDATEYRPLVEVNQIVRTTLHMMAPNWRLGRLQLRQVPEEPGLTADGYASARLTVTLAPAGYVAANATDIRRALTNIILNALEAVPSHQGLVEVTSGRDGRWAFIKVRDNGAGVPDGAEEEIFQRSVSTKGSDYRGLGLAISRRVAEEHGGSLDIASGAAMGSTFTLRLPLVKFR